MGSPEGGLDSQMGKQFSEKGLLAQQRGLGGSYLSAAGGVSGGCRGLLGPTAAEMLVEPERGGSGGFSSSTSVDREQWDSS